MKVLSVFGTRPEAIKMAPVVKELEKHPDSFQSLVCVTAQHHRMLDQVLSLFDIAPDYDLDIMSSGQDLFDITCAVLTDIEAITEGVQLLLDDSSSYREMSMAHNPYGDSRAVSRIVAALRDFSCGRFPAPR